MTTWARCSVKHCTWLQNERELQEFKPERLRAYFSLSEWRLCQSSSENATGSSALEECLVSLAYLFISSVEQHAALK